MTRSLGRVIYCLILIASHPNERRGIHGDSPRETAFLLWFLETVLGTVPERPFGDRPSETAFLLGFRGVCPRGMAFDLFDQGLIFG